MTDTKAEVLARAKLVVDGLFNFGPGLTEHDRIVFVAGVIDQAREEGRRDARVEDLLRDAAEAKRLREIVNTIVPAVGGFDPDNEGQVDEVALEWSKRYHAALRDAERLDWLLLSHVVMASVSPDAWLLAKTPAEKRSLIDAEIAREKAG